MTVSVTGMTILVAGMTVSPAVLTAKKQKAPIPLGIGAFIRLALGF